MDEELKYNILLNSSDFDYDFYQMLYDIRTWYSPLKLFEAYKIAIESVENLIHQGWIKIIKISYKEIEKDMFDVVSREDISTEDAIVLLNDPRLWDVNGSYQTAESCYKLSTTEKGEQFLDRKMGK